VLSFLRFDADGNSIAVFINFAGHPHHNFRAGVPAGGEWRELLNTDAEVYGGSGVGNFGSVAAASIPSHGREFSVELTLPPLAAVWLYRPAG